MAAPPQLDLDPVVRLPADTITATPPRPDRDPAPPDPYAPLRALQRSHGNYYVQRTIDRYNATHPLPKPKPKPALPKPSEAYDKPTATEQPESAAKPAPSPYAATPRKTAAPAPPKPAPHPKQAAALGKAAPMSGSAAVTAALSAAPRVTKSAAKPMPSAAPAGGAKAGGPTLAQWKSKVAATAGKDLVAPDPTAAPKAAGALDADAKKKADAPKTDFGAAAAKVIPAPPKVEVPSAPADTLAKSVHDLIAGVSDKHLTDQTLPELQRSPGHAGITYPDGQFPMVGAPAVTKQDQPTLDVATTTAPPAANTDTAQAEAQKKEADQKLAEAEAKKKAMEAFLGPIPPPSATLHDTGPKPRPVIPAAAKSDIAESIAVVLSKSEEEAKEMVGLAEKTTYPHAALQEWAPEIAKDAAAPEKTRLDGELHAVAEAAGVEASEVDAKAHARAEEEKQQCFAADEDLQSKATGANSATTKKAADDQKAIAAAKARNDDEIELKGEAAGTPPDPKLVNEREQRLLDALDEQSSNARVAYRKALEARNNEIDKAASDQMDAYRKTAQSEADEIKGLFPDDADKAKTEAWPSTSWADREAKAVRDAVAILKRDTGQESKGFQNTVSVAQTKATLQIHDWADERLSRTRSFWEKIIALFLHWEHAAKSDTDAWEKARNQDTADAMAGDLATIANIKDLAAKQNIEEMKAAINGLDEQHQILLMQFFKSGGDSIMAVAGALLGRIEQRRVPELADEFRKKSLDLNDWETLNKLAQSLDPGFNAWHEAGEVRQSVKGWGTDEDRLFAALKHRTPLQVKAMKLAYAERYRNMDPDSGDYGKTRDMEEDIHDDLSGDEDDRATAALSGDIAGQDAAALHQALTGFWGTDKATIMETLRNKSPAEADDLLARYKDEYGIDLRDHLLYNLTDETDRDRASALLAGDTDKADALGIQAALHSHIFGGAEITEVDAVYAQIRKEVEADAAKRNMNTAEVEAEYKRRAAAVEQQWNGKYADGKQDGMKEAFKDRLSGGEQDLAISLAEDNHIAEDAARIRMESESILYTSDKKVLSVLEKQRERAETEVRRDMMVRYREMAAKEKWTPEEAKKKFDEMNAQAEKDIDVKAQANLDNLEKHYDKAYSRGWGPGELTTVIEFEMSGNEQEEARLLRKQAGKLSPAQQVYWAVKGLGTDDQLLKRGLKGKTAAELAVMREEYKKVAGDPNADMDADVLDDVSGRDQFDYFGSGDKLQAEPATPEEQLQRNHEKRDYETGSGSGLGSLFADEEADSLQRTSNKTDQAYKTYQDTVAAHGKDSKEAQAALDRFHEWSGYSDESITELRAAVDTVTDHAAMAAAIIVGAIVAIATAGTVTPAVIAAVSALAATSASITVKLAMKGHAYGIEEYGQDVLMGGVDVAVAAMTAGVGNALLRTNLLSRLAEDQLVTRVAKYGIAHAGAGLIAGLPTSVLGQVISADTWASDTPLKTALLGILKTEAMAGGMAAGFGGIEAIKGGHAPAAHEETSTGSKGSKGPGDIPLHDQKPPAPDLESQAKQAAKASSSTDLENKLKATVKPDEQPHPGASSQPKQAQPGEPAVPEPRTAAPPDTAPTARAPATDVDPYPSGLAHLVETEPEAFDSYNLSIDDDPAREAAIYQDLRTGKYVVVQGEATTVPTDFSVEPGMQSVWKLVEHYHPGADYGARFASSPDFRAVMHNMVTGQEPLGSVSTRIRYTDPVTGEARYTSIGFDPIAEKQYWIEVLDHEGNLRTLRFEDPPWKAGSDYKAFMTSEGIPDEMPAATSGGGGQPAIKGATAPSVPEPGAPPKASEAATRKQLKGIRRRIQDLQAQHEDLENRSLEGELSDSERRQIARAQGDIGLLQAEENRLEAALGDRQITPEQRKALADKFLEANPEARKSSLVRNEETRAMVSELEDILGHEPDPLERLMAAIRGTNQDTKFKKSILPEIRKLMPKDSLFSTKDWREFQKLLGLSKMPWEGANGPDLFLVDPDSHRIRPVDLTGRPDPGHLALKQLQADALQKLLPGWTVEPAIDIYHGGRISPAKAIAQLQQLLEAYGMKPQ